MNDYLSRHPDIFMGKKELHYFGKDLMSKTRPSEQEYLEYFQGANGAKIVGDASVWYLFSETAAKEIKEFAPGARILIMLRNPLIVIHSLHSQHLYDGNEDVLDFETALGLDEERKKGNHLPDSVGYTRLPPYKDSVLFSAQVKRYVDVFGKENVRIILYEDFITNTEKVVSETLEFLGVKTKFQIDYHVINANKRIKWFYLHRVIKRPPLKLKKMVRVMLPFRSVRHFIMFNLLKWNIKKGKRDEMDPELNRKLKTFFRQDIDSLGKMIGKDLSGWVE